MSLILIDGFDHSDAADVWTSVDGGAVSTAVARTGLRSWFLTSGGFVYRSLTGGEEDDGVTIGVAFLHDIGSASFDTGGGILLREGATTVHLHARFKNGTRSIQLWRGPAVTGTLLAETDANIWTFNTWHYFELKGKIANSGGTAEVRLNGVTVLSFTGDTQDGGTALCDRAEIAGAPTGQFIAIDDVYILNEQGSAPHNTFLGDTRCWPLYPSGNGNYSQFVGSDGNSTDNYLLVDEAGAPSSSDYVASAGDGNKDTYAFEDLPPTTGSIFGVEIRMYAAKEDSGARSMRSLVRRSGTDVAGADQPLAAGSYFTFRQLYELDPVAAAAWTITNVNGSEFGVEARP